MLTLNRRGTLVGLLVLSTACSGSGPVTPTPVSPPVIPSRPAPPPTNFPPLSGPSRTFTFDQAVVPGVRAYTEQSRFVLYDTGGFALQYLSLGIEYRGGYTESNGVITFEWEGWSTAGPWGATGTLKDRSLTVQYNVIMMMSDFEDAVYRLTQ
jgi:hypothetical protein